MAQRRLAAVSPSRRQYVRPISGPHINSSSRPRPIQCHSCLARSPFAYPRPDSVITSVGPGRFHWHRAQLDSSMHCESGSTVVATSREYSKCPTLAWNPKHVSLVIFYPPPVNPSVCQASADPLALLPSKALFFIRMARLPFPGRSNDDLAHPHLRRLASTLRLDTACLRTAASTALDSPRYLSPLVSARSEIRILRSSERFTHRRTGRRPRSENSTLDCILRCYLCAENAAIWS